MSLKSTNAGEFSLWVPLEVGFNSGALTRTTSGASPSGLRPKSGAGLRRGSKTFMQAAVVG